MRAPTYRTRPWLRAAVLAAATFWAAVVALLVATHPAAGVPALLGALAFACFFAGYAALYDRTAVVVTPDGFVFQTLFRRVQVRSEEILEVSVMNGLGGTLYAVLTRRGLFRFTSLLARHRELLDLLLERGGLQRRI